VLEAVFFLLESLSPSRRVSIGSNSLPSLVRRFRPSGSCSASALLKVSLSLVPPLFPLFFGFYSSINVAAMFCLKPELCFLSIFSSSA
jgi:hypothetical protein